MLPEVLSIARLLAAAGRGQARRDRRAGGGRHRRERVSFHRSRVRSDAASPTREVDEIFAGRARAPRSRGRTALAVAREVARALAARRDAVEIGNAGADLRVRLRRPRDRRAPRGADRVAPPDRAAHDPGQRAGRRLPRRPPPADPLPRPRARPTRRPSRSCASSSPASTCPTPPVPEHMTPQQAADLAAEVSRIVAREAGDRTALGGARPALAQAGLLLAEEPRPRRARQRRATATSPRRSGATRTSWRTGRCSRGSASTRPPRPPHELAESGVSDSATEREAMKIERGADDVCLAFLLERHLAEHDERQRSRARSSA